MPGLAATLQACPPSIVINRNTGEVSCRPISDADRSYLWAMVFSAQMDLEEGRHGE